jgi:anti-sigma factor (TIGR02949 family)
VTREITNCEEAIRVLAEHLDDELDGERRAQLLRHLDACRSCCSRAEFERQLKEQIQDLASEAVPAGVTDRVQRLLREFGEPTTQ